MYKFCGQTCFTWWILDLLEYSQTPAKIGWTTIQ